MQRKILRFLMGICLISLDVGLAAAPTAEILKKEATSTTDNPKGEAIPDWMARWEIARVLSYQKKYPESLEEYEKLLKSKPDLVEARIEMATVFFYTKRKDETLRILEAIPREKWNDDAKALAANIYASDKNYKEAEPLYLDYLTKHPDDLKIRLKYADMLSWQKKYADSVREYQKILRERPNDIQLKRKYAMVLIWSGRQDDGIRELRSTLNDP